MIDNGELFVINIHLPRHLVMRRRVDTSSTEGDTDREERGDNNLDHPDSKV